MRWLMGAALPLALLVAMTGGVAAQSPSVSPAPASALPDWAADLTDGPGSDSDPSGLPWAPAPGLTWSTETQVRNLIAWSGGFAMVGLVRTPPRGLLLDGIWHSADGVAWESTPMPEGVQNVAAFLPFRGGLVLASRRPVGFSGDLFRLDLWRSDDAVTWERAGTLRGSLPAGLETPWRIMPLRLFVADDRLVQLALVDWVTGSGGDRMGGPTLAMVGEPIAGVRPGPARMLGWVSRDGTDWHRRPVRGAIADGFGSTLDLFTTVPEGVIARRVGGREAVVESADGLSWTDLAPMPSGYRWGGNEGLVIADGQPLLFSEEQPADPSPLAGWTLGTDVAWTQVLAVPDVWLYGQASEASSVVLTGRTNDRGSDWPWVIVSTDGARTWDRDLSWVGPNRGCLGDVAIANGIVTMVGCEPGGPAIWTAPLPEVAVPGG